MDANAYFVIALSYFGTDKSEFMVVPPRIELGSPLYQSGVLNLSTMGLEKPIQFSVGRLGLEPRTYGLKVQCDSISPTTQNLVGRRGFEPLLHRLRAECASTDTNDRKLPDSPSSHALDQQRRSLTNS